MFYRAVCRFSFIKFVFGIICLCAECWSVRVSVRRRRNFIEQFIPKHAHIRQMPAAIHRIDCDLFAFESTVATVNVINYRAICERCRRAVSFFVRLFFVDFFLLSNNSASNGLCGHYRTSNQRGHFKIENSRF